MEYFREPNNTIQAGFALNAGKLLIQYQKIADSLPLESRYDATLIVCVLQSLLTNCSELIDSMKRHLRQVWMEPLPDIPYQWGLRRGFVKKDTFPPPLTYERFIKHLRNSLSHPTIPEKEQILPSTGYTTIPGSSGIIEAFQFTDSPWVDRGKDFSRYVSSDLHKVKESLRRFKRSDDFHLDITCNDNKNYYITYNNAHYRPIFIAEIPLDALFRISLELSNYLAQPTQKHWNGKSVHQLVA